MNTIELMQQKLAILSPTAIQITDDSAKHAGHAGAKSGGGHYQLAITSADFASKPTIARHRMIYDALGDMMQQQIHALSIKAQTPEETQS